MNDTTVNTRKKKLKILKTKKCWMFKKKKS